MGVERRTIDSGSPARAIVARRPPGRAASPRGTTPGPPRRAASGTGPQDRRRSGSRAGLPSRGRAGGGPGRRPTPDAAACSSVPAGASSRPPANSASIRPKPSDCWPADRAATQPPTVERSHDCGKWPSVSAVRRERRLERPARPSRRRRSRARSARPGRGARRAAPVATVIDRPSSSGSGVTPPTTLVPPPYGISVAPRRAAQPSRSRTSSRRRGRATASGTRPSRPLRSATQSGRLWPRACRTRSTGSIDRPGSAARRDWRDRVATTSSSARRAAAGRARPPPRGGGRASADARRCRVFVDPAVPAPHRTLGPW